MGGIDRRLDKLEQEAGGLYETLQLPDGSTLRYEAGEMFEALCAVLDRREHRLLSALRSIDTAEGMPGLVRALEGSRARREGESDGA